MFADIAKELKTTNSISRSLNKDEMQHLMLSVVNSLVESNASVKGNVNKLSVKFDSDREEAVVFSSVRIDSPIKANINLGFIFQNDSSCPDKIKLLEYKVDEKPDGLMAKVALSAINLHSKIGTSLKDVNETLKKAINAQLHQYGTKVEQVSLRIGKDSLAIRLYST